MNLTVINYHLSASSVYVDTVASSSVVLIGDTETITLSSMFDTPPESMIIGPIVPLTSEEES